MTFKNNNFLDKFLIEEREMTAIWEMDSDMRFTYWSEEMNLLFPSFIKKRLPSISEFITIFDEHERDKFLGTLIECLRSQRDFSIECMVAFEDGPDKVLLTTGKVIKTTDGQLSRVVGTFQDISFTKTIKSKVENLDTIVSTITENLSSGIWAVEAATDKVLYVSKAVIDIYGYTPEEFQQNPYLWNECIHADDQKKVELKQKELLIYGRIAHQYRIITKGGEIKWLYDQTITICGEDNKQTYRIGIVGDVSQLVKSSENVSHLSNYDVLTDLPNRRFFMKRLNELIKVSSSEQIPFTLFYVDLDNFKYINDYLSHDQGDLALIEMATRLKGFVRSSCFLARLASDEFVFILEGTNQKEEVIEFAKKVNSTIEEPFLFSGQELTLTASIGICFFPEDGTNVHTLLKSADMALYRAKENGKNHFQIYSKTMDKKITRFFASDLELRKAIRNEEFFLEYQPKVDAKTRTIVGAEALIRWNHPEKGRISPMNFIPIAEENGLIAGIGDWVFHKVCKDLNKWLEQGIDVVPISVNLSPKRLIVPGISQHIKSIVQQYHLDPSLLCIEITERSILLNEQQSQNVIRELKDFGIRFALDDFGTGYSSLTSLINFDIDILKIDKLFIGGMFQKSRNKHIIQYLISLAKSIGILVVAEGVETEDQLHYLLELECPIIQGYLFSKPLKTNDFVECLIKKEIDISSNE